MFSGKLRDLCDLVLIENSEFPVGLVHLTLSSYKIVKHEWRGQSTRVQDLGTKPTHCCCDFIKAGRLERGGSRLKAAAHFSRIMIPPKRTFAEQFPPGAIRQDWLISPSRALINRMAWKKFRRCRPTNRIRPKRKAAFDSTTRHFGVPLVPLQQTTMSMQMHGHRPWAARKRREREATGGMQWNPMSER